MLIVASHRNVPPNWAETAGPNSHSPAPTEEPARKNARSKEARPFPPGNNGSWFERADFPRGQLTGGHSLS